MQLTLETAIHRKSNNFDLIRLIASVSVIFGHSFYLFPTNGYAEPIQKLLINNYSGSLAVYIFFFLSGIFITSSFVNSKTLIGFLAMRIFRIWPALIICILITVFVVGPVFSTKSLHDYFIQRQTWRYLIKNSLMMNFEPKLNSVFEKNLLNKATNGSLWTLPAEIKCYFLVLICGIFNLLKHKITVLLIMALLFFFRHNPYIIQFFVYPELVKFMLFFFLGMLGYTFRSYIIINYKIAISLIIVSLVVYFINFSLFTNIFLVAFIYSMLVFATSEIIKKIRLPGDYSYGIYIYGFLIQQIMADLFSKLTTYQSMLITIPLTSILGIISWHFVEHPAINTGKKLKIRFSQWKLLNDINA